MSNRQDKYTQQSKQKEIFTDFLTDFDVNPDTGELYRNVNLFAIKQSLRSLILTNKGERLFQGTVGSNIRKQIFELYTSETMVVLKKYIEATMAFEPRSVYVDCVIVPSEDNNGLHITIDFSTITNPGVVQSVTILLARVR